MILGVGVDLAEVLRIERILDSPHGLRFLQRVFTAEERDVCERSGARAQPYAARFAAKEAFAKAIGTGFSRGVGPSQISVVGGERTRPTIRLSGAALKFAKSIGVGTIHVSLSHTKGYACALVVLESESPDPLGTAW